MADPWSYVAEAVDTRRSALGLSWRQVQERGGPSEATMLKLINGYQPIVTARKRAALSIALDWPNDAVDRLLAGEQLTVAEREDRLAAALEALKEIQAAQTQVLKALVAEIRSQRGQPPEPPQQPQGD